MSSRSPTYVRVSEVAADGPAFDAEHVRALSESLLGSASTTNTEPRRPVLHPSRPLASRSAVKRRFRFGGILASGAAALCIGAVIGAWPSAPVATDPEPTFQVVSNRTYLPSTSASAVQASSPMPMTTRPTVLAASVVRLPAGPVVTRSPDSRTAVAVSEVLRAQPPAIAPSPPTRRASGTSRRVKPFDTRRATFTCGATESVVEDLVCDALTSETTTATSSDAQAVETEFAATQPRGRTVVP